MKTSLTLRPLRRRVLQSAFTVGRLRLTCGLRSLLVLHRRVKLFPGLRTLNQTGAALLTVVVLSTTVATLIFSILALTTINLRTTSVEQKSLSALNTAEAGINYYLWHLSHDPTDYQDGTGAPSSPPYGPYTHDYRDPSGALIGTYTLYITPPAGGSTVTTVQSVGQAVGSNGKRVIEAQLGIPSFANYALLTGTEVWFGPGENSDGPVHSNVGVHFDAVNNGLVTASNGTYTPTAPFGGDGQVHPGVWGTGGPTSQWQYPVLAVDFTKVTADLQNLKTQAQSGGVYLAPAGAFNVNRGYYLKLKNNNTIDVYRVTNQASSGVITTTFIRNQAAPGNGVFYVEDNVWVDGTYASRLTIVSGRLPDVPATNTTIKMYNNISYTVEDGTVAIGLIAQKDIAISRNVPNNLEIDAALLAQKGHVWFPNYSGSNVKGNLTFYGAIASYDFWTWSWICCGGVVTDGFPTSTTSFDDHLIFNPPPQFPTTGAFTVLNWREQLYQP